MYYGSAVVEICNISHSGRSLLAVYGLFGRSIIGPRKSGTNPYTILKVSQHHNVLLRAALTPGSVLCMRVKSIIIMWAIPTLLPIFVQQHVQTSNTPCLLTRVGMLSLKDVCYFIIHLAWKLAVTVYYFTRISS